MQNQLNDARPRSVDRRHHRILITYHYSLDTPGGGTRSCLKIAEHLEKLGEEVVLVPISAQESTLQRGNATVVPVAPHPMHKLLSSIPMAKTVKTLLRQQPADAVLSWDYEGAGLPRWLQNQGTVFGMIAAKPSYQDWIDRPSGSPVKRFSDQWFRWRSFKQANVVFVSSQFTQQELITLLKLQPDRIKITHRGIDDLFSQVARSPSREITNFIFYGSFEPNKGVFDALSAMGQLAAQGYHHWTLKLAGWGNEAAVAQAIADLGIGDRVINLGRLNPEQLAQELQWAHVALLPSQAESFGRSIAEAQAAGLPVIAYDAGSVPEIIQHGVTGWLAPRLQVDRLTEAIGEAIAQPAQTGQMGLAGRDRVLQKFGWPQTAQAILDGIEAAKLRSNV